MLAETVLAAFAASLALFKAQQFYGTMYEQRTARLRERTRAFYAAADVMLANDSLDERHLGFLKLMSETIDEPGSARKWSRELAHLCERKRRKASSPVRPRMPFEDLTLMRDFAAMTEAAFLLIAERSLIWGPSIRRHIAEIRKTAPNSQEREASIFESVLDDRMMHAA